ncbi:hypothetical protein OBP_130 [Pseudomonas phage OBP]|uniref:hypothetical protein n=1 Tax=Pseudomonas phage OBP TaxID=1124849 RepID=UPI000240D557|nr:hypothetical protein OBP_130 [Pseudomonas phage OBP]AEV89567.1 hypothetical protein OBP_130 [Pseudomonas phage OBP]
MNTSTTKVNSLFYPKTLEDFFHIFQVLCVHNQVMYREEALPIIAEIDHTHHTETALAFEGKRLVTVMEPVLAMMPKEPTRTNPGDLSLGSGESYKLIHLYTFDEIFHPERVAPKTPLVKEKAERRTPITMEQFTAADKRSLTRPEWICVEDFIHAGGFGWRCALKTQHRLWGVFPGGIIDHIRTGLDKLGYDHTEYL